jgi:hypothetical protein
VSSEGTHQLTATVAPPAKRRRRSAAVTANEQTHGVLNSSVARW